MGVRIAGTGSYLPDQVVSNEDIGHMVNTSDEWIRTRTGVEERRLAAPEETSSSMAILAAERALSAAGVKGEDLDAILVATITPDHIFPNTAALIQRHFHCKAAFCFDLSAACAGFLSAFEVASSLMKANRNLYRNVLVCGTDKLSVIVDWNDRNSCILFGDGAGCMVLINDDTDPNDTILSARFYADGNHTDMLCIPAGGSYIPASEESVEKHEHFIYMEGRETFKHAVNGMVSASRDVLESAGISADRLSLVIPHQANIRIIQAVAQHLGVPSERVFSNIRHCGNTSSASIGIALDEAYRKQLIQRGDFVLFTAFGGGLVWGSILIRF